LSVVRNTQRQGHYICISCDILSLGSSSCFSSRHGRRRHIKRATQAICRLYIHGYVT